jgi:outer membrane lipoprotein SlyB
MVIEKHEVTLKNGEGLQDNTTGMIGGGLAGALLGSTIGHGEGEVVAEVAGGLGGAVGGAALEEKLRSDKAMQYIVQLENGDMKTVVQAIEPRFEVGDKVFLMESNKGRSRIEAR